MTNLYAETAEPAIESPPLKGNQSVEVAVVGAGFTGLSAALHLAERGVRVAVIESEAPGFGASGRNGGQVNPGLKPDPDTVERDHGADLGTRMNAFAGGAPQFVFDLIARHGIRCDARRNGTLRAAITERSARAVRVTAQQWQRRGADIEMLEGDAVTDVTGTNRYRAALLDRRGGDLNPLSFAHGLARVASAAGASIYGGSQVLALKRIGSAWQLNTHAGSVIAPRVLLATNGYSGALMPPLARSVVPVFGAIAATGPLPEELARRILPTRSVLFESGAITVYYRIDTGNRLLFGGRGPMQEVSRREQVRPLTTYAASLWPELKDVTWQHVWGGRLAMTWDHYPHVHELAPGVHAALGYNGRGVALSTALGAQLARLLAEPGTPLDMPVTPLKPIAMHGFWKTGVRMAILKGRLLDSLGLS